MKTSLDLLALAFERWLPDDVLAMPPLPATLVQLGERLRLTDFEQGVLLLAAAPDLDPRFKPLLARVHGDPAMPWLTLGLAMRCLPGAHWDAITPAGRLRRWQLLELSGAANALEARLVLDETILHRLAGCPCPDPRLEPWFRHLDAATSQADGLQAIAA